VANASLELLLNSPWQERVESIQTQLRLELEACKELEIVKEVRVLGAIGVVELRKNVDLAFMTPAFVSNGVWVRPFLNLVYVMPPYVITQKELAKLTNAIFKVIEAYNAK
jgi:adenosylmethionine-8-amino-7-oxononanoate aminotransferase